MAPEAAPGRALLGQRAPAKVNLTLRLLGRRADGYHDLESLVAFAAVGDHLALEPGRDLALHVEGATAEAAGPLGDNLVLKAARALADRVPGIRVGRFVLAKQLPVAAGLGGGSADAAAALRLLARLNGMPLDDARLYAAAAATGADVPVCLDPHPRVMRGIGERLSARLALPPLPAVLVNPGVAVATADVFRALREAPPWQDPNRPSRPIEQILFTGGTGEDVAAALARNVNDLEPAAIRLAPPIAEALERLGKTAGCLLARMSGSGATCFALFATAEEASTAAAQLQAHEPAWWVRPTVLGSAVAV